MKYAAIGLVAASVLALAGCSGTPADSPSGAPKPASTDVAAGPTSSPITGVGNTDDPLCAAAQANIDDSNSLESKTSDLTTMLQDPGFLTGNDTTALKAWGKDMLSLTDTATTFYQTGVDQTKGEAVNADFVTLSTFVDTYTTALAQAASDATSIKDFMSTIQTLFTSDGVTAAVKAAPAAATSVSAYLGTRCGFTG